MVDGKKQTVKSSRFIIEDDQSSRSARRAPFHFFEYLEKKGQYNEEFLASARLSSPRGPYQPKKFI